MPAPVLRHPLGGLRLGGVTRGLVWGFPFNPRLQRRCSLFLWKKEKLLPPKKQAVVLLSPLLGRGKEKPPPAPPPNPPNAQERGLWVAALSWNQGLQTQVGTGRCENHSVNASPRGSHDLSLATPPGNLKVDTI